MLEVLVSMTILAFGCVIVLDATNQIVSSALQVSVTETTVLEADQYMAAISLWSGDELDRHLGSHRRGVWVLDVQRPSATLYEISIMDSTASHEWLRTTLYRPAALSAQ